MVDYKEEVVPLGDEELAQSIAIILAAHSAKFPQLKGKAISPDRRHDQRRRFAEKMVSRLRQSQVVFFKRVTDRPLMLNSGCFPEHKR
jgi:hypothetical protein